MPSKKDIQFSENDPDFPITSSTDPFNPPVGFGPLATKARAVRKKKEQKLPPKPWSRSNTKADGPRSLYSALFQPAKTGGLLSLVVWRSIKGAACNEEVAI